jgi:hypothetical protein
MRLSLFNGPMAWDRRFLNRTVSAQHQTSVAELAQLVSSQFDRAKTYNFDWLRVCQMPHFSRERAQQHLLTASDLKRRSRWIRLFFYLALAGLAFAAFPPLRWVFPAGGNVLGVS